MPHLSRHLLSSFVLAASLSVGALMGSPAASARGLDALPHKTATTSQTSFVAAMQQALRSEAARTLDANLQQADDFRIQVHTFGNRQVVRVQPVLHGIPVEGADRVLTYKEGLPASYRVTHAAVLQKAGFVLDAGHALEVAHQATPASLLVDPTVENVAGFSKKVYLAVGKRVRPAYKVRVPTLQLRNLQDVWVDAETGVVLRRQAVAKFADGGVVDGGMLDGGMLDGGMSDAGAADAGSGDVDSGVVSDAGAPADAGADTDAGLPPVVDAGPPPAAPTRARVFEWAPAATGVDPTDLVEVDLPGLRPAEVGAPLRGFHVETFNCCKEYVCNDGSAECGIADRRCANDDDDDPITSNISLQVPADFLPIELPTDVIYARVAFCSELPRVRSKEADGDRPAGWFESPVDSTRADNELLGLASEEDTFSEVQVYYTTMQFFLHLRSILDDDTWCLGGDSMQCEADGSPVLGEDGNPVRPFHVATNVLIPELDFNTIGQQLLTGAGQDPGNPVVIDDYQRLDNAAFVPALTGGGIQVPPELETLLEIFNRPYDSNLYFQGANDFSYDGSIVFHEFTHAVVHSFVPGLFSISKDQYGGNAWAGALNEGWADYFSSSYRNDPLMGAYGAQGLNAGELALRNNDNDYTCPRDIVGQVHNDSEPWSGALWDIREHVIDTHGEAAVPDLDAALLLALSQSEDDASFEGAAALAAAAIEDAFDADTRTFAEETFAARGITGCVRLMPLVELDADGEAQIGVKDELHVPGPRDVGLANMAGAPMQFSVEVPAGTSGFQLRWSQSAGGLAGQFTGEGEVPELAVLVHETDQPLTWQYEGADADQAAVYDADDFAVDFVPNDHRASYEGSDATFDVVFDEVDACESRTFVVQMVGTDSSTIAGNITASVTADDEAECASGTPDAGTGEPEPDVPDGCGCNIGGVGVGDADTSPPQPMGLALLVLLGAALRRRRSR